MPVTWWFVFLLAAWSVGCGDYPMLPVAVVAGSFCMQTHLPYLGLVGAIVGVGLIALLVYTWRSPHERERLRDLWKWIGIGTAVGVVLWLPPLVQQFTNHPGNLQVIVDTLRDPREALAGPKRGLSLLFLNLNPWRLFTTRHLTPDQRTVTGAVTPGILFALAWLAAAVVALRTRVRSLVALHFVIAIALLFAATSMTRIAGRIWFYLVLWASGLCILMAVAIIATIGVVLAQRWSVETRERALRIGTAMCAGIIVVSTAWFVVDATDTDVPNPPITNSVGAVAPPTIAALNAGKVPGGGRDGRYLVTWDDVMTLGGRGYSLLLELERHGFHVGATKPYHVGVRPHRVMSRSDATAEVHLVSGPTIDAWAQHPGVVRVAYYDPRTPAQVAELRRLQTTISARLHRLGLDRLATSLARGNLGVALDPNVPPELARSVGRVLEIGLPVAVFVGPVSR
jgi:hypothetical protein